MNKILAFLFRNDPKPNIPPVMKKQKISNNSQTAELEKITNYHYNSKFTSITDKIHDNLSSRPSSSKEHSNHHTDLEEIEVLRTLKKPEEDKPKIELTKFDLFILSFVCFCVEFGFFQFFQFRIIAE